MCSWCLLAGVSGQAWATYLPSEKAPSDGSKPRGATVFARDFQTVVIYDAQGKFVGVRRPGSALPIQVACITDSGATTYFCWRPKAYRPSCSFTGIQQLLVAVSGCVAQNRLSSYHTLWYSISIGCSNSPLTGWVFYYIVL